MVEAYMDESGIHETAHVCAVGGYFGSVKKWERFECEWSDIIRSAGERTLKEFHSTDFWFADGTRKGVFAEWSDAKAETFIDDLVNCIVNSKIFPTTAVLMVQEWNKLNRDERTFLTGGRWHKTENYWLTQGAPNKTYFLPFQCAIANAAINCRPGLHVHYTFDLQKQFKTHAIELYALMKTDPNLNCRHRLGALDFEISEKAVGLQAADLLTYQTYKFGKQRIAVDAPLRISELPPLLRRLIRNQTQENDFPFFDAYGLQVALHNMPEHLRSPGFTPITIAD